MKSSISPRPGRFRRRLAGRDWSACLADVRTLAPPTLPARPSSSSSSPEGDRDPSLGDSSAALRPKGSGSSPMLSSSASASRLSPRAPPRHECSLGPPPLLAPPCSKSIRSGNPCRGSSRPATPSSLSSSSMIAPLRGRRRAPGGKWRLRSKMRLSSSSWPGPSRPGGQGSVTCGCCCC